MNRDGVDVMTVAFVGDETTKKNGGRRYVRFGETNGVDIC